MFRQMKKMRMDTTLAQTLTEYSMVLGIIVLVTTAMVPMIKRSAQSMIKLTADQIGIQENGEQRAFISNETQGYLESANSAMKISADKTTRDFLGKQSYTSGDVTFSSTNSVTVIGFSE